MGQLQGINHPIDGYEQERLGVGRNPKGGVSKFMSH